MKNVSNGEIVAEGGDHQRPSRKENGDEDDNARAARGFAQPFPVLDERDESGDKTIDTQRQSEEQGKTANLRHWDTGSIFSETHLPSNRFRPKMATYSGTWDAKAVSGSSNETEYVAGKSAGTSFEQCSD